MLPSPCVGICRLDPGTGWCLGCARSADELTLWRDLPPDRQAQVWADLPRRKAVLGLAFRLLPYGGSSLSDCLARLALTPGTGWSIGVYGAIAEFMAHEGETLLLARSQDELLLRTRGGAIRLWPPPGARLFELAGSAGRAERLVLALHRARVRDVPSVGITELGADAQAIDPSGRDHRLFDLGVTRSAIRFCVRTGDTQLLALLRDARGRDLLDPATGVGELLVARSPDRVVISPVGRIEVTGPILRTDHAGPHTHLLPPLLVQRRELEPGFDLPEGYLAAAVIYPPVAAAAFSPAGHVLPEP
jgi:predicted Fe-S protein YdhL (DUF1289 family)